MGKLSVNAEHTVSTADAAAKENGTVEASIPAFESPAAIVCPCAAIVSPWDSPIFTMSFSMIKVARSPTEGRHSWKTNEYENTK